MKDSKVNLCDDCGLCMPDCNASDFKFGDGKGNDNIIECDCAVGNVTAQGGKWGGFSPTAQLAFIRDWRHRDRFRVSCFIIAADNVDVIAHDGGAVHLPAGGH